MANSWKFTDEPLTACYVTPSVLKGSPITRVIHDFDGDWQFIDKAGTSKPKLVSLESIVKQDPTVQELHDLPYAWFADRDTPSSPWRRAKYNAFPEFPKNGYYLEDAIGFSMNFEDIETPDEDELLELQEGDQVKLLFRFADETEQRLDNQVEKIWVDVIGFDSFGDFIGTIANDPLHPTAKYGDEVHFHARHVAQIGETDQEDC